MRLLVPFACFGLTCALVACEAAEPDPMVEHLALRCTTDLAPDPERVETLHDDLAAIAAARGEQPIDLRALRGYARITIEAPPGRIGELVDGEADFDRLNARLGGAPRWDGFSDTLTIDFARVYAEDALVPLYAEAVGIEARDIRVNEVPAEEDRIAFDIVSTPHRYLVTTRRGAEAWEVEGGVARRAVTSGGGLCR